MCCNRSKCEKTKLIIIAIGITITKQPEKSMVVRKDSKFHLYCKATNQYGKKMKYEWFHGKALYLNYIM